MDNLRELRLALVEAEHALRETKDRFVAAKAECEQAAINSGQASGKNAEERERNMTLYLGTHKTYQIILQSLRQTEYQRDRAEAILEAAKDARRKWEWDIRLRLADAIERAAVQTKHDDYSDEDVWDDTVDEHVAHGISGDLASQPEYTVGGVTYSRDHERQQAADDLYVQTQKAQAHSLRTSGAQDWWDNLPKAQSDDLDF